MLPNLKLVLTWLMQLINNCKLLFNIKRQSIWIAFFLFPLTRESLTAIGELKTNHQINRWK